MGFHRYDKKRLLKQARGELARMPSPVIIVGERGKRHDALQRALSIESCSKCGRDFTRKLTTSSSDYKWEMLRYCRSCNKTEIVKFDGTSVWVDGDEIKRREDAVFEKLLKKGVK